MVPDEEPKRGRGGSPDPKAAKAKVDFPSTPTPAVVDDGGAPPPPATSPDADEPAEVHSGGRSPGGAMAHVLVDVSAANVHDDIVGSAFPFQRVTIVWKDLKYMVPNPAFSKSDKVGGGGRIAPLRGCGPTTPTPPNDPYPPPSVAALRRRPSAGPAGPRFAPRDHRVGGTGAFDCAYGRFRSGEDDADGLHRGSQDNRGDHGRGPRKVWKHVIGREIMGLRDDWKVMPAVLTSPSPRLHPPPPSQGQLMVNGHPKDQATWSRVMG